MHLASLTCYLPHGKLSRSNSVYYHDDFQQENLPNRYSYHHFNNRTPMHAPPGRAVPMVPLGPRTQYTTLAHQGTCLVARCSVHCGCACGRGECRRRPGMHGKEGHCQGVMESPFSRRRPLIPEHRTQGLRTVSSTHPRGSFV